MKKSFVQVQFKGNSLQRKSKMLMLFVLVLIAGIAMALIFVLKPASPAMKKPVQLALRRALTTL